ncbi:PAS sensor-containing diguanylate cyclase/phosphodiesterase [Campylobacter iguaniorum]|uniref:diguanylate cyclase domain-containing protein n=1 Tax=Campylobacter iguaniorum TaxID=1244531 RepID=UPI0007C8A84F|nr:EAL domain-containing protein [Campylobacter iguaniorum]ANE35460.1 PAS sensor-containing diguanylate cyclase/phosphodiesterase [Campylobacter iguaniorum]
MKVDKIRDSFSSGLLKRAYLISIISIFAIVFLLFFVFSSKVEKLEDELKANNLYYMTNVINQINYVYHDLSVISQEDLLAYKFEEIVAKNGAVMSIYLINDKLDILASINHSGNKLNKFQIEHHKKEFESKDTFISKFYYYNDDISFYIYIPTTNNKAFIVEMDAKEFVKNMLAYSKQKNGFLIDSDGFMLPGDKGYSVYDDFDLDILWKTTKHSIAITTKNDRFCFYHIYFNEALNLGVVSRKSVFEFFSTDLALMTCLFLILVLVCFIVLDLFLFFKYRIIAQVDGLQKLLNGLKIGEIPTKIINYDQKFLNISNNILNLYLNQVIAKNDLRDYKGQYSLISQKSNINILFVDAKNGNIIDASQAAIDFYGYEKTELIAMNIFDLQITNQYDESYNQISSVYGCDSIVCNHRLSNGDIRIVRISSTIITTNFNSFYFMIVWDITDEQKKIDNINSEKVFLELSPILIVSFELDDIWKVVQISNNVQSILGYKLEDILLTKFSFKTLIHDDDISAILRDVTHRAKLVGTSYESDTEFDRLCRVKMANGKFEWFKIFIKIFKTDISTTATIFMFKNTEQKVMEDIYKERINKYQNLLLSTSSMPWDYDCKTRILTFSHSFALLLGYDGLDELGVVTYPNLSKVIHKNDLIKLDNAYESYVNGLSDSLFVELRFIKKDGEPIWIQIKGRAISKDINGVPVQLCGMLEDISKKIESRSQIKLIANIFSYAREGMVITALDGTIIDINDSFTYITGYAKEDVLGRTPSILKSNRHDDAFYKKMWDDIQDIGFWHGEIWNRRKNGEIYPEILTISSVRGEDDELLHYIAIFSDMTRNKDNEEKLRKIAHYDTLTKVPNKFLALEYLKDFMDNADKTQRKFALAYIDLDGFKIANDIYGHHCGDAVLVKMTNFIKDALRANDILARFGGDEFVIIINDVENQAEFTSLLDSIIIATSNEIVVGSNKIALSASMGVTIYPQTTNLSINDLLKQADWAMYHAKLAGKNRYYIFDTQKDMLFDYYNDLLISSDKFEDNEFIPMYQPIIDVGLGAITSFELLVRWKHPVKGIMLPLDFLNILRNKKWFNEFSIWVIKNAINAINSLPNSDIKFSVNVPFYQLMNDEFYAKFEELYVDKAPFSRLVIEITDTPLAQYPDIKPGIFDRYKKFGIDFVFDDFDANTAVVNILRDIPTSIYKISKSYATTLLTDVKNIEIIKNILCLCNAFGKIAILKGIENNYIYKIATDLGFKRIQGNFISKPVLSQDIKAVIEDIVVQKVNEPKEDRSSYYEFLVFQMVCITKITISINSNNSLLFDYTEYIKKYKEYLDKIVAVPKCCEDVKNIIDRLHNEELDKQIKDSLLAELESKRLCILNSIDGD